MDRILRRLFPQINRHLSDDCLASFLCDELSAVEVLVAKRHLSRCRQCRFRRETLEGPRADLSLQIFKNAAVQERSQPSAEKRAAVLRQVDGYIANHIANTAPRGPSEFRLRQFFFPELPHMNPILATCMVLGLATIVSFFLWLGQRTPNISSNALLVRAEKWDNANFTSTGRVVYQAVRIATPQHTLERTIYRDPQGKRQAKLVKLDETQQNLKNRLTGVDVDWEQPLSAS